MPENVKLHITLDPVPDGWPPYGGESFWATPLGDGKFRIANVLFFAEGYHTGDVVFADEDGEVGSVVEASGNDTLLVWLLDGAERRDELVALLREHDLTPEAGLDASQLAVSVPAGSDFDPAVLDQAFSEDELFWARKDDMRAIMAE